MFATFTAINNPDLTPLPTPLATPNPQPVHRSPRVETKIHISKSHPRPIIIRHFSPFSNLSLSLSFFQSSRSSDQTRPLICILLRFLIQCAHVPSRSRARGAVAQVPLLIKRRHVWSPRSYRYTLKLYTLVSPAGVIRGQPTVVATRDVSLACMCTRTCNTRVFIGV